VKLQHCLSLALSASLLLCSATALADTSDTQSQQGPQTASEILQFQKDLRSKLDNPTGEYSQLSEKDIADMKHAQDDVFRMLSGVQSLDQLNLDDKTRLSNSLDEIKSILLSNRDNRLICRRERRTGTNLVEKRCETVAQREARSRDAKEQMREMSTTVQTRSGN
jgi:hypothetical protein